MNKAILAVGIALLLAGVALAGVPAVKKMAAPVASTKEVEATSATATSIAGQMGKVVIEDAHHPSKVHKKEEFKWHVVGHVVKDRVYQPGVAYYYKKGPSDTVTIVADDGTKHKLVEGMARAVYYPRSWKDPCTKIDSRKKLRGAIFPDKGTYEIWLLSGFVKKKTFYYHDYRKYSVRSRARPPVAKFKVRPEKPKVGDNVTFDASGSHDPDGRIVEYKWKFGDGTTGTGEVVTHSYGEADNYTVTLKVTDDDGLTDSASETIRVVSKWSEIIGWIKEPKHLALILIALSMVVMGVAVTRE